MPARLNQIILIAGGRGTGKTTFALKLIQSSPKKSLIIDTLDHPTYRNYPVVTIDKLKLWKSGTYRIFEGNPVNIMNEVNRHVWNANIILEDAFKYLSPNMKKDEISLFIDCKQHNQDIIIMFHALAQIPPNLIRLSDKLVLFRTKENLSPKNNRFYNWDEIFFAHQRIMRHPNPHYCEAISL